MNDKNSNAVIFNYYENGYHERYMLIDLIILWDQEIDQDNFFNFDTWLYEMIHMQILNPS